MMLTSSVLPNLPLDQPAKKTTSGAGARETMQGSEPGGFGKLLVREISNKPDMSRAEPGDKSIAVQKGGKNGMAATEGSERAAASTDRSEDAASVENTGKSESASVISIPCQLIDCTNVPKASIMGQWQVAAEVSAAARAHAHVEHRLDTQPIATEGYGQSGDEVSEVPSGKAATPADLLADTPRTEEERAATDYATLLGQSPGLISGNFAPAGTHTRPDPAVILQRGSQIAGISGGKYADRAADVSGDLSTAVVAGVQDEAAGTGRSAALQFGAAAGYDTDTRQDGFKRPEFRLMESASASEPGRLPNISADVPSQNLSAIHAETGLLATAIEPGHAPTSTAPASSPDQSLPTLEPRPGAAGWDNALGQKIIWMVSQQQQIAELSLNPPDIGPLQIVLSIDNDQASAMFVSHNAEVRQALEAALPRLKEMMADSGISLGNTTISSDSSEQRGLMEGFERRNQSGARYAGDDGPTNVSDGERASIARIGVSSLVDTFA